MCFSSHSMSSRTSRMVSFSPASRASWTCLAPVVPKVSIGSPCSRQPSTPTIATSTLSTPTRASASTAVAIWLASSTISAIFGLSAAIQPPKVDRPPSQTL